MTSWDYRYQHIPILITMKPTPRILLGKRLFWTEKRDGSNVAIWIKRNPHNKKEYIQISSRNMVEAASDIQALVRRTEEYPKILKLLEEYPEFVIYVEACRKGRSITGIELYEKDFLIIFDIYNRSTKKFLPYINTHQHGFHHDVPVVGLWAETRHTSMKDLLKWKNYALKHCRAVGLEGMVIKWYGVPKNADYFQEFKKGLVQAKVKLDIPEPKRRKIGRGEVILPPIPDNEIFGAIDKAWQELGDEKFKDVSKAMPLIARHVSEECKQHLYSKPTKKLFALYKEFVERMLNIEGVASSE